MSGTVLMGRGRKLIRLDRGEWEKQLLQIPQHMKQRLSFMSKDHHRVRYFVVRELPRIGKPIQPARIARDLRLSLTRVVTILDELEKNLFFLVRNKEGSVVWAYPVTIDESPHRLTFSTGERLLVMVYLCVERIPQLAPLVSRRATILPLCLNDQAHQKTQTCSPNPSSTSFLRKPIPPPRRLNRRRIPMP